MQLLPQILTIPGAPWFKNQVVGKNTLSSIVKDMCEETTSLVRLTTLCMRETDVTKMYIGGVPKHIMLDCTELGWLASI